MGGGEGSGMEAAALWRQKSNFQSQADEEQAPILGHPRDLTSRDVYRLSGTSVPVSS